MRTVEVTDATGLWRSDMVAFSIARTCSFEAPPVAGGVPLRNLTQGRGVAMSVTDRQCTPAAGRTGLWW
ncbi:hypothetical protein AB0F91_01290 [Amycolatopsis sp. NPDC023774]|uniref:hypothetical protein n=1 Tax=Amycolatopsis sp. NPDC023774 TaxID=3155015 RepID=UPI0033EA082D